MLKPKQFVAIIIAVVAALFILPTIYSAFYTVKEGHKGIVFNWGQINSIEAPGLHFKVPYQQSIEIVDVRTQKATAEASAGTSDMQSIHASITVNWHFDDIKKVYQSFGLAVEDKIIDPRIQEAVKGVVAKYTAEQLIRNRETVKSDITLALKKLIAGYSIIIEDVQITNLAPSKAFMDAIENKQIAEQSALTAKNDLERIKVEAQQKIESAKAEAEAIRIQAEAIKSNGGDAYVRKLEVEKWNGNIPLGVKNLYVPNSTVTAN